MQKFIRCIIWCCALAIHAAAQPANISRVEYYIDTDPGFGKATTVTITAATSLTNIAVNINPVNVGYGVHILGIRAQNANGKWGIDNKWIFARPYAADTGAQAPVANISRVEYYLDNDPGFGKATAVTITPGTSLANITLSINPANVGYGVHVLGVRALNANGKWSIDNRWLFARPYPSDTAKTATSNITRVEYYIDKDPGFGKAKTITFTPGTSLANVAINVPVDSTLASGVHVLGIRAQNALGNWGIDNKWLFARPYATDTVAYKATAIKQIEYYFDTDPGYGKGIPVIVDTGTFNLAGLNLAINISGLTAAGHNLFVRARNANGNWGFVYKYSFKVSAAVTAPAIAINRLLRKAAYCAKDTLAFSYDAAGTYAAGNQFTLQLSDTAGAFTTPTTVGTFTATGDSIVKLALPAHLTEGNKYRIRLVSSNPVVTGITGSDTLVIHDAPRTVTITGDSAVNIAAANPYSVTAITGYTWKWLATNTTPAASANTASITWPSAGTQTIKVIAANQYGCGGDTTVKVVNAYLLRIDSVNLATLKPCPGDSMAVTAKVSGAYKTGNVFTVQLSDTAGNFTSPVKIGSLPLVAAGSLVPVTIKVGLPNTLINGIHYRVRIIGSTPADTSAVTSSYLVVQKPNLGKDTTVYTCAGSSISLVNIYNTTGLTATWSTARPDSIVAKGTYTLYVTNANGCRDTAVITLNNYPKPNLGNDTVITIGTNSTANITTLYNTTGLTYTYSTATPVAVGAGVYTLVVTNSNGCKDTAVITVKTVALPPVIYSFGPATGGAGVPVTIKGRYFTGAAVVSFGGTAAASYSVLSDTVISAITGNGASGNILVTTPSGTATLAGFVFCTPVSPSVTITANVASPICAGTKVNFTATAVNGGTAPVYQWYKNNTVVGSASSYTDSLLKNSDSVWVVVTSNASCLVANTAKSNVLKYVVNAAALPSVTITANVASPICAGTKVTFTATAVNGGTATVYQWYKNNTVVGSASTYTDSLLKNSDSVWVVVTSNASCLVANTAKSNVLKYVVNAAALPSVTIAANFASPVCAGTKVTFTATAVNGGTAPVYQWYKNNTVVGSASTYTDSLLKNSDSVWVIVTSNASCLVANTAKSNVLKYVVNASVTPSVTITANVASPVCAGTKVTFTATAVNGGTAPVYQWYKNNTVVGSASTYTDSLLKNSDSVWLVVTSNAACLVANTAKSNVLKYVVNAAASPSVTITANVASPICAGTKVTFTATAVNGGTAPVYQWYKNNTVVGSASSYTDSLLKNSDSVWVVVTSNAPCLVANTAKSNVLKYVVNAAASPSVTIAANFASPVCAGTRVTFTATAINGGTAPVYQWYKNNTVVGSASTYTDSLLKNSDSVWVVVTSNASCLVANTAKSSVVVFAVNAIAAPVVTITASSNGVPYGSVINFTATATNGGSSPVYTFFINGTQVQTGASNLFSTNLLQNADVVSCTLTSNYTCATSTTATSNNIIASVTGSNPGKWQDVGNMPFINSSYISLVVSSTNVPFAYFNDTRNNNRGTVKTFTGSAWVNVGDSASLPKTGTLAVSPSGIPYVAGFVDTSTRITVMRFANGVWQTVGSVASMPYGSSNVLIKFATDGTPYLGFVVYDNISTNTFPNVMKFNGSSWVYVGNANFYTGGTNFIDFGLSPTNVPYMLFGDMTQPRLASTCFKFDGTNWVLVGPQGFSTAGSYVSIAFGTDGTPYVCGVERQIGTNRWKASVLNYNGTTWQTVGGTYVSADTAIYPRLIISPENVPVVLYEHTTFGSQPYSNYWLARKYSNGSWSQVGGNVSGIADQNTITPSIVLAPNGTLYAAYTNFTTLTTQVKQYTGAIPATITISSAPASPVCANTPVLFTAAITNGGASPLYQWMKNGAIVGTGSTYKDSLLKTGDSVLCVLSVAGITYTSNVLKYVVNAAASPSVTIAANVASPICAGTKVTFTATAVNGGTAPSYQWKKNGINVGTNSAVYTDSLLKTGDTVKVVLTASGPCIVSTQVSSNGITFNVNPVPVVSITGTGCGIAYISSNLNFEQAVWNLNGSVAQTTVNVWSSTPATVAGTGVAGSGLNQLNSPGESLLDSYGNLYITDRANSRVVKWAPGATAGVVVAGGNGAGSALNQLSTPLGLWLDAKSNLYVVEYGNNRVTKWAPGAAAGIIVAGGNGAGAGLNQFNGPHSITGDTAGNIYVTDQSNNRVTKWAPGATSGIAVIASGQVSQPQGITIDGASNLYVAEFSGSRVTKWAPGATSGVIVAGTGTAGTASNQLNGPIGVNVDKTGALFVTDFLNNRVQRWLPATGSTGSVASTTFARPLSTAVDASGNLYVLEETNNRVIKFTPGKTDSVLHTATPGVYTATVSTYAGCTVTTAPYTQATASTPAVSITTNTGTVVCGSVPVTFTATPVNGGSAPSYQWKRNGVNVGANLPTYIDSVPVNGDSIYVLLTSNAACLVSGMATSNGIKLTVNAKPNLGRDTALAVCTGSYINIKNLYSITGYTTAVWNVARPDSVVAAGKDTLIVTTSAGCRDTAVVIVTSVAPPAKPVLTKTGNTTFCLGDSLVLNANAAAGLQWYRNNQPIKAATLSRYVVRASGSYKLKVTGSGGCAVWSDSVIATVNQVPIPTITLVNDTLVSSSLTGNQWFENGVPIPGATTPKYSPYNIDVYTVQVTSGSCVSAMSYPYLYTAGTMGFKGKNKGTANALLYPNPATDAAKLQLSGFTSGVIATITDMTGRVVWQQDKLTNSTYTLPLSNLAQGMYLVTIKDKTTIRTIRLIKAK